MKKELKDLEKGDKVYKDGYTSMAQQNAGTHIVVGVKTKYDEDTGEPYKIVKLEDDEWFDTRDGGCYSNHYYMYYIEPIND